jgi:hypothetical protein
VILELSQDEMIIFNSLIESGLSDFAVLAQMFDIYGITTRMFKSSDVAEAIRGCVAS